MKTESTPPGDPPTPPSAMAKAASTSPTTATTALADDAPRAKKAGVGPVRTRAAPSKTFVCRGFGDCSMVFSRSEHLARHVRKHTGERPFACHCGKQFSRLDNLRQHAQTVHSDKADLNERMMRDLTSLHTALAASSHRNLPRLSPSQPTASQGSRSQPSTPNDTHPPSNPFFRASPFGPTNPFGANTFQSRRPFPRAIVPTPLSQTIDFNRQPMTFTLTLPDGTASADFHLPTPPILMGPLSAPILGETDTTGLLSNDWTHATGPWTMAEGLSPLRAEAAQGVGSLQSRPSSPESSMHNPYFPPIPRDLPPQVASPVGALPPDLSDALPPRQAAGSRLSMDARGLLQGPRQQLHHSASDPQLHHHARGRAVVSGASIGVGMYSPLSRQHWLPQDTTMGMMIDRQGIEMGMGPLGPLGSHLDSGLGLHPRPPSTELDGAESGSGSDPGMDATSRLSAEVDAASLDEMIAMNADIMARGDMSAQRTMAGMANDWPPLDILLPPQSGHPIHRWSDVDSLEGFTPETPTERSDYYRPTGEDTTRRFPTIHRDSHPANGRMTLGLEMPQDRTQGPHLDDLPSWNYAQPSPHQMIMPQGLHSAFRPMASPPLSGDGSPRPSFDLRLSAAGIAAGFQGLPASAIEPGRTRYMSEPGPFPSDQQQQQQARQGQRFATPTGEGTRYPHHPLHPQQPWDAGMMTVSNGLGLGSGPTGSSEMTPPPQVNENANANDYSSDGIQLMDHPTANPTDSNGERAYPTPLSAHPRLPVTGENANGSEVKYEHPSPRLLPLPE